MNLRRSLIALLTLFCTGFASAQTVQDAMNELNRAAGVVKSKYATSQSMLNIAQMSNNAREYQLAQIGMQYNEQAYQYLENLAQDPGQLLTPQGWATYQSALWEYEYRTQHRDYRSYQEIEPAMQQFIAQRNWEVSTPEGQQAYNNRRQQAQANFDQNQANHRARNQQFDNYMTGLREASNQNDKYQHQYVNTIHDQYEYVNPYDGQGYVYPNTSNSNPSMENPDGSTTELVPYQNW